VVLLLSGAGSVGALTYEENLDDNPEIATALRLERLSKRIDRQVERLKKIRELYAAIDGAIEPGKALAAETEEQLKQFRAGAQSSTVGAAVGQGAPRGLAWHCSRAREIVPQLSILSASLETSLRSHRQRLGAIPVGSDNAVSTLQSLAASLEADVNRQLQSDDQAQLRSDLREIEQGLPHAYGTYTTLKLLADGTSQKAVSLLQLVAQLRADADATSPLIETYVREDEIIGKTFVAIRPEFAADIALRESIQDRRRESVLPGNKHDSYGIVQAASFYSDQWQPIADRGQAAATEGLRPLAQALSSCGSWQQPPRDFADGRAAAGQSLGEQFIRIDEAYAARSEQIGQARQRAEEVKQIDQRTVAELDRKLASAGGEGRRQGNKLRADAVQEIARMDRGITALDDEQRVVEQQREMATGIRTRVMSLFQSND